MISFKNSFSYKDYALNNKYFEYRNKLWVEYSSRAYVKYPLFDFDIPAINELEHVFENTRAHLLSYSIIARQNNRNAYLYLCKEYPAYKLKENFLRNIKKAQKSFEIKIIKGDELEKSGFQAYYDTRKRLGLNDFHMKNFKERFSAPNLRKNSMIVAAMHNHELAAFASVLAYHDFLEIEGLFSSNDYLKDRPNDLIMHTILNTALNIDKMFAVSYGFSSIQDDTNEEGLHRFKMKCGFEAIEIKRCFIVHPKYKWMINSFTKFLVKLMLKMFPANVKLRKINGILNHL